MLSQAVLNHDAPMLLLTALGIVGCHEALATGSGLHRSYRIIVRLQISATLEYSKQTNWTPQSGLVLCCVIFIHSNSLLKADRERRLPVHERRPVKSLMSTLNAHAAFALATLCYSLWAKVGLAVSIWVSTPLTCRFLMLRPRYTDDQWGGTDFSIECQLLVSHAASAGLACLQTWKREADECAEREGRKGSLDEDTLQST